MSESAKWPWSPIFPRRRANIDAGKPRKRKGIKVNSSDRSGGSAELTVTPIIEIGAAFAESGASRIGVAGKVRNLLASFSRVVVVSLCDTLG